MCTKRQLREENCARSPGGSAKVNMTQPPPRRSSGPLNGAESSGGGAGLGTGVEPETSNSESHYNSPALKVTKYFSSSPNHSGSVPKKSNQNKSRTMCPRPRSLPNTELFLNFSRRMISSTFRYRYIAPRKLQIPGGCTRSTVATLPPFQNAALRSNPDPGLRAVAAQPAGIVVRSRVPFLVRAGSRGLCSPFGPAVAQPRLRCSLPPTRSVPSGANLLRSRGEPCMRQLAGGFRGGARGPARFRAPCRAACLAAAVTSWRRG